MKTQIATLIERRSSEGVKLTGTLGDAVLIVERSGQTRAGEPRWRLMIAAPTKPAAGKERQAENRRGASWRIAARKAEQVEFLGGKD